MQDKPKKPISEKRRGQLHSAQATYYATHGDTIRAKRRAKYAEMKAALEELNAQRERERERDRMQRDLTTLEDE